MAVLFIQHERIQSVLVFCPQVILIDIIVKHDAKDEQGHHQKSDVPILSPVFHYYKHMGGVDKLAQFPVF